MEPLSLYCLKVAAEVNAKQDGPETFEDLLRWIGQLEKAPIWACFM